MTEEIFRDDAYAKTGEAVVVGVDAGGIELDRTIFYPMGGGQPGDAGILRAADGREVSIIDTRKDRDTGRHMHIPADDAPVLVPGDNVTMEIDWQTRHKLMRMHTTLHLICAIVDAEITGCQIGAEKSRIDLNLQEGKPDKELIQAKLDELVAQDLAVSAGWITDDELAAKPGLVKTMSVQPPTGMGSVRLMRIEGIDLQPCGGTHVARTGEIGKLRVGKIENKGKHNRRINVHLED
jgi:misacylated tRNA(Ala) deacylase